MWSQRIVPVRAFSMLSTAPPYTYALMWPRHSHCTSRAGSASRPHASQLPAHPARLCRLLRLVRRLTLARSGLYAASRPPAPAPVAALHRPPPADSAPVASPVPLGRTRALAFPPSCILHCPPPAGYAPDLCVALPPLPLRACFGLATRPCVCSTSPPARPHVVLVGSPLSMPASSPRCSHSLRAVG